MRIDLLFAVSVAVAVGLASFLAYSGIVRPLQGDVAGYVKLYGRFNVVWTGNGSASDVEKGFFLTYADGDRIELKVTPYTRFMGGQSLSGFDGKMLNVLGRSDSSGMLEAVSIG